MHRRSAALCFILLLASISLPGVTTSSQIDSEATPVTADPPIVDESTDPQPIESDTAGPSALEPETQYCILRGGVLVERFPFAAVDTGEPVALAGSQWFCEFTGSPEADPPSSRISVALSTLYAAQPTLAGTAYIAAPHRAIEPASPDAASAYCSGVGGSSHFGSSRDGSGGWASDVSNPANTVITVCMFPDGSAIDDWGLYYRSIGTIRGTDLQDAFRHSIEPEVIELFTSP